MILYIKVENGQTVEHPVADWNLMQVFGGVPVNYEPFLRTEKPPVGTYEVEDDTVPQYGKNEEGMWTDLWPTRPMTPEERAVKESEVMDRLENLRAHLIQMSEDNAKKAKNDMTRDAALAYAEEIRNLVVTPDEDFIFPQPPLILPNGELLPPNTESGSVPDVIG